MQPKTPLAIPALALALALALLQLASGQPSAKAIDLEKYLGEADYSSQDRVVGGFGVPDEENVPYQISMQYRTNSGAQKHFCGGSIISPTRILTAAHCVNGQDPKRISVVAGIIDLNDESGQRSQVQSFTIHENYQELITSDLAILNIDPPLKLDGERAAAIDVSGTEMVDGGVPVILTGWGALWHFGTGPLARYPTRLQQLNYKTIKNERCKRSMPNLTETEICALERFGKGACNGDSGGPLVMQNGETLRQVGVVSYGTAFCASNSPDVYTRVSVFDDWIKARLA